MKRLVAIPEWASATARSSSSTRSRASTSSPGVAQRLHVVAQLGDGVSVGLEDAAHLGELAAMLPRGTG